jgi:hypothetical protein
MCDRLGVAWSACVVREEAMPLAVIFHFVETCRHMFSADGGQVCFRVSGGYQVDIM